MFKQGNHICRQMLVLNKIRNQIKICYFQNTTIKNGRFKENKQIITELCLTLT